MEQMPNSELNAQLNSSAHTCHNTMLSASALSSANKVYSHICKKMSTEAKRAIVLFVHFVVLIPFYFWFTYLVNVDIFRFLFAFTAGILMTVSSLYVRREYLS
jgi:hypothetical protein